MHLRAPRFPTAMCRNLKPVLRVNVTHGLPSLACHHVIRPTHAYPAAGTTRSATTDWRGWPTPAPIRSSPAARRSWGRRKFSEISWKEIPPRRALPRLLRDGGEGGYSARGPVSGRGWRLHLRGLTGPGFEEGVPGMWRKGGTGGRGSCSSSRSSGGCTLPCK